MGYEAPANTGVKVNCALSPLDISPCKKHFQSVYSASPLLSLLDMPLDFKACKSVHTRLKARSGTLRGLVKAYVYKLLKREAYIVLCKLSVKYGLLVSLYQRKHKELFSGLVTACKLVYVRKLYSYFGFGVYKAYLPLPSVL